MVTLNTTRAVILSKILLESALWKDEVAEIINIFVERAVDKERRRIKRLTELELDSYQELKIYQKQDKSPTSYFSHFRCHCGPTSIVT